MGAAEPQGFVVNRGHARDSQLHALAPIDKKDVVVLHQNDNPTGNDDAGIRVSVVGIGAGLPLSQSVAGEAEPRCTVSKMTAGS